MTSIDKEHTLAIKIKASLRLSLIIIIPHTLIFIVAVFCTVFVSIHWMYLVFSGVLILTSFIYYFRLYIKKSLKGSIHSLYKNHLDQWSIELSGSSKRKVNILGFSFISDFFIILNMIDESNKQFTAIITSDNVTHEQFRKLKVFINTNKLLN